MADLRHLGFQGSNNGFFEKPMQAYDFIQVVNRHHSYKLLSFSENRVFAFCRQTDRQTDKLTDRPTNKLLSFSENCVFAFCRQTDRQTDRQTNRQTDEQVYSTDALSCSRCRERRLNNSRKLRNLCTVPHLNSTPSYRVNPSQFRIGVQYMHFTVAVAERLRDTSCLSVFSSTIHHLLSVTSASHSSVRTVKFCSVLFSVPVEVCCHRKDSLMRDVSSSVCRDKQTPPHNFTARSICLV